MVIDITIQRGVNAASPTVKATKTRSEFELIDEEGVSMKVESEDFIIRTRDYTVGGNIVEPACGDKIREVLNGKTRLYEVTNIGSEQQYRYADPQNNANLRVHTKLVSES